MMRERKKTPICLCHTKNAFYRANINISNNMLRRQKIGQGHKLMVVVVLRILREEGMRYDTPVMTQNPSSHVVWKIGEGNGHTAQLSMNGGSKSQGPLPIALA
ncbi:hypothetical protein TNCV_4991091 [Trichonephila clavipes]|nr:hypothetical protein TNCV_4991091 [Trichonephila clavipes]